MAVWGRTNVLRFVARDEVRILQQKWIDRETGKTEWVDVPLEKEE